MDNKRMSQNIVVVDHTPENLRLLVGILAKQGYQVRPAPNGVHALATIRKEAPDLVLLDILMPDMDGYEVCRQLKADQDTHIRNIPIIFVSALSEVFDKLAAFEMGGVDYITKPFQVEEVMARVETHLTIRDLQQKLQEKNEMLETKNKQLQEAFDNIKTLKGLIPICANCKMIRDDEGFWQQVEVYIETHSEAEFSHSICPDCKTELYPDLYKPNS